MRPRSRRDQTSRVSKTREVSDAKPSQTHPSTQAQDTQIMIQELNPHWPVLKHYDQNHLARIALPLGGIGAGTVALGGRGQLTDWEVYSHPDKGFTPQHAFFALWAKPAGEPAVARALEGAIEPWLYEGAAGCTVPNHGLPRFRHCAFDVAYPLAQVSLSDPDVPVDARIEAFNPLVPADADASGIPIAVLRFVLTNKTGKTVTASVCGNLQNFIGNDGAHKLAKRNVTAFRQDGQLSGLFMQPGEIDPRAEQHGTLALAALASTGVSYRTAWSVTGWNTALLDYWDDFAEDGRLEERALTSDTAPATDLTADSPIGSLAAQVKLPPHATKSVTFLLTWHFPNRQTWTPAKPDDPACGPDRDCNRVGNHYATRYRDAWDVAAHTAGQLASLERQTVQFVRAVCDSDLPAVVKEAALFNLSTLRTQTTFRTEDGRMLGWEGCFDKVGCCYGSCTHVWNYEQATAYLFGDLAKSMREVEFAQATDDAGLMSFRVDLPIERAQGFARAAADGQMGCLMKLYRDWQLSGDDAMLRMLWPKARRALEFCWIPGGWDADQDGVMEGCQHNTMDVEYYGPNPQMEGWYLGALRACEEMARYLGEANFAATCRDLFERGRAWTDAHLFNGEYYEHEVRPPASDDSVAQGLRVGMGAANLTEPAFQLGAGCLVDQLVGQFMAHVCGLGYLLDPRHVQTTLRSILKHNWRSNFHGHFNNMRSFVLGDESALLMGTYPKGRRPKQPFPYTTEVMTGFEYTAAIGMLYEGQTKNGLKCISAIRDRYDGRKRSPFDEAECGHHYARAMASWAALLALTGFHYSGVTQTMTFAASDTPVTWFWSNGSAWGTCAQMPGKDGIAVEVAVLFGALKLKTLALAGAGEVVLKASRTLTAGKKLTLRV